MNIYCTSQSNCAFFSDGGAHSSHFQIPGIASPIPSADRLIDKHGVKLTDSTAVQQQPTPPTAFLFDAGGECAGSQESLTSLLAAGGGQGSPHTGTVSTIVLAEPRTDSEESNMSALKHEGVDAPRSGSSPASCWEATAASGPKTRNSCSDYVIDSTRRAGTSSGPGGGLGPRACSEPEQLLLLANSRDAGVTNQTRRSGREQTNGRPAFKSDTERRSSSKTPVVDSLLSREVES
jgi:hypothetical protein